MVLGAIKALGFRSGSFYLLIRELQGRKNLRHNRQQHLTNSSASGEAHTCMCAHIMCKHTYICTLTRDRDSDKKNIEHVQSTQRLPTQLKD